MKRKRIITTILALALLAAVAIEPAVAYFTATRTNAGAVIIDVGNRTTIEEPDVVEWTKHIVVNCKEDSVPVYVRARAYAGVTFPLEYTVPEGSKWKDGGDGWWYYEDILYPGQSTEEELLVHIGNVPKDAVEGDYFNVSIVSEDTPVLYDAEGNPYADWDLRFSNMDAEEGGNE